MKKFIRYLYEYQNGRRVQNVGFVKVNESDDTVVVQIYGKGFPAAGNQTLEILLFYLMKNQPVGISMGRVKSNQPMFGYRLEYTVNDVGGMENFRNIEGIILLSENNGFQRWYGAVWNEKPVNIERMIRREEMRPEPEEPDRKEMEPEEPDRKEMMPEEPVLEEPVREEPAREEPAREEPTPEEPAPEVQDQNPQEQPGRDVIYKITRQDMAKLPRREWKLANNQFLMHGYRNYHHLVSFEKDGKCWLGVPGIYHPQEQRAANAFGFEQFMKPGEGEIELSPEEMNEQEDFGYWCRPVGAVIADGTEDVIR